jgi:coronin-1B/1C/6
LAQSDAFQSDLYPNALSEHCALSSSEWLSGKNAQPILVDMETRQQSTSTVTSTPARSYAPPAVVSTPPTPTATARAPQPQATPVRHEVVTRTPTPPTPAAVVAPTPVAVAAPAPVAASNGAVHDQEIKDLRAENAKLKLEIAERDTLVRELELKLEKVKVSSSASD